MKTVDSSTNKIALLSIFIVMFIFCACAPIVDYKSNIIDKVPSSWSIKIDNLEIHTGKWWESFNDSTFITYFNEFQNNSPDLKSIAAQAALAKNIAKISGANIFPSLSLSSSASARQQNTAAFGFPSSLNNIFTSGGDSTKNSDQSSNNESSAVSFTSNNAALNLGMQWEVDIWGKLLNARRAAYKDFESSKNELAYLKFSIGVQYVNVYFTAVESSAQYKLALETTDALNKIKNIVVNRYGKGLSSSLDVRLAESSLAINRLAEENRLVQRSGYIRNLEVLMGKYPSASLEVSRKFPDEYPRVPAGLPITLIERRPDVKAAINNLEASGYRLAQSKRELLPAISLTASTGTSSSDLKDILNGDYAVWNLATNITAPIFQSGRLRANVALNKNQVLLAKINAMKKLLQAFSEVEQSLAFETSVERQYLAVLEAEKQSEAAYGLAVIRYEKGVSDLITVLNSQQQLFSVKSQKYSLQNQRIRARVNLFLALGGDFNNMEARE